MNSFAIVLAIFGIVVQSVFIVVEHRKRYVLSVILKGTASVLFWRHWCHRTVHGSYESELCKDNCDVVLGWMPIEQMADLTIYPDFIKETIYELDALPRHFITRA